MEERYILGLIEQVTLLGNENKEQVLTARIDTGATSSSVDLNLAEDLNLKQTERTKVVKSASGIKKRPLVKARVKINGVIIEEEFTLADRNHMTYPLLIGQDILKKGKFLIDPLK